MAKYNIPGSIMLPESLLRHLSMYEKQAQCEIFISNYRLDFPTQILLFSLPFLCSGYLLSMKCLPLSLLLTLASPHFSLLTVFPSHTHTHTHTQLNERKNLAWQFHSYCPFEVQELSLKSNLLDTHLIFFKFWKEQTKKCVNVKEFPQWGKLCFRFTLNEIKMFFLVQLFVPSMMRIPPTTVR